MITTTAASIPGLGSLADQRLRAAWLRAHPRRHRHRGRRRRVHDELASVIDPAELRWIWLTHTDFDHIGVPGHLARGEPAAADHHDVPRRRHHGVVRPPAPGPGAPRQPGPVGHRRATAAHRDEATCLRQPDHHRLPRRRSPGPCSAPTASAALLPTSPTTLPTSTEEELRQGQVFWALSTPLAAQDRPERAWPRNSTPSASSSPPDPQQPPASRSRRRPRSPPWRTGRGVAHGPLRRSHPCGPRSHAQPTGHGQLNRAVGGSAVASSSIIRHSSPTDRPAGRGRRGR